MNVNRLRSTRRRLVRGVLPLILATTLLAIPSALSAAGTTDLQGSVRGIEICPQIWCGSAIFIGEFDGALDDTATDGSWWVLVNHEALPDPGKSTPITGGAWSLRAGERALRGTISTGTILNNGDGTFDVIPRLDIASGGDGTLSLSIRLDHAPFPPTVAGNVAAGAVTAGAISSAP